MSARWDLGNLARSWKSSKIRSWMSVTLGVWISTPSCWRRRKRKGAFFLSIKESRGRNSIFQIDRLKRSFVCRLSSNIHRQGARSSRALCTQFLSAEEAEEEEEEKTGTPRVFLAPRPTTTTNVWLDKPCATFLLLLVASSKQPVLSISLSRVRKEWRWESGKLSQGMPSGVRWNTVLVVPRWWTSCQERSVARPWRTWRRREREREGRRRLRRQQQRPHPYHRLFRAQRESSHGAAPWRR